MMRAAAAAVALVVACGCGSSDSDEAGAGTAGSGGSGATGGSGGTAGTGGSAGSGGVTAAYPDGPYGNAMGDTVANLQWEGYVNDTATGLASDQPFVDYSMDDLRRSGRSYALVHTSEFF